MDVWGLSLWYIDALIDYDNSDEVWRFTRFYGHLETNKREETWTLLESLKHNNQIPWFCIGDFNEITSSSDKAGGSIRQARQMDRFRRVIHHCAFQDLGFVGSPFTWLKNNGEEGRIRVRLDRALANNEWQGKFQGATLHHIAISTSDHSLLPLWFPHIKFQPQGGVKLFRFEAMWLQDPRCDGVVQEAWQEGLYRPGGCQFLNCLDSCLNCLNSCWIRLVSWNKIEFGRVQHKIVGLQKNYIAWNFRVEVMTIES